MSRFVSDHTTGEILNSVELHKEDVEKFKERYQELLRESRSIGVPLNIRLKTIKNKEITLANVKEGYDFLKTYTVAMRLVMENFDLQPMSLAFIAMFTPYIEFPYNHIMIGGNFPDRVALGEKLKVKRNKLFEIIKELEYYEIIKCENFGKKVIIYFNPFLYNRGLVAEDTYILFKDSSFNPY